MFFMEEGKGSGSRKSRQEAAGLKSGEVGREWQRPGLGLGAAPLPQVCPTAASSQNPLRRRAGESPASVPDPGVPSPPPPYGAPPAGWPAAAEMPRGPRAARARWADGGAGSRGLAVAGEASARPPWAPCGAGARRSARDRVGSVAGCAALRPRRQRLLWAGLPLRPGGGQGASAAGAGRARPGGQVPERRFRDGRRHGCRAGTTERADSARTPESPRGPGAAPAPRWGALLRAHSRACAPRGEDGTPGRPRGPPSGCGRPSRAREETRPGCAGPAGLSARGRHSTANGAAGSGATLRPQHRGHRVTEGCVVFKWKTESAGGAVVSLTHNCSATESAGWGSGSPKGRGRPPTARGSSIWGGRAGRGTGARGLGCRGPGRASGTSEAAPAGKGQGRSCGQRGLFPRAGAEDPGPRPPAAADTVPWGRPHPRQAAGRGVFPDFHPERQERVLPAVDNSRIQSWPLLV